MSGERVIVAGLLCLMLSGRAMAEEDALDKVSGTESWSAPAASAAGDEWQEWYRARVSWRRMLRQARIQQVVNARLAVLLTREAGGPSYEQVLRVIRAGNRQVQGLPAPVRGALPPVAGSQGEPAPELGEEPAASEDAEPGTWTEVPVERLDDSGQAVDDEGDRELKRLNKKR